MLIRTIIMSTEGRFTTLIVLFVLIGELNGQKTCLASNNQRWKSKRGKCVDCPSCPDGKARNLTELYEGPSVPEGDTQCLPCRECPDGFYAGASGCQPCRVLCDKDYFREYDEICEGSHDARCGSCLFGYDDLLRNINFPCSPAQSVIQHTTAKPDTDSHVGVAGNESSGINAGVVKLAPGLNPDGDDPTIAEVSIAAACVLLVLACAVTCFIFYHKRRQNVGSQMLSTGDPEGVDNDIQIDGQGSQFSSKSEVRGELMDAAPKMPRPELSAPVTTETPLLVGFRTDHTVAERCPLSPCGCEEIPDCRCYQVLVPTINIQKSDDYLLIVSKHICHYERQLYTELNVGDNEIYAAENDRKQDPVEVTLPNKVLSLLNRWVEKKPEEATLHTLMKALCKSRFHKINEKIVDKLLSDNLNVLENDNGGAR